MMKLIVSSVGIFQNVMPLSAGLFKSEHKNPVSQCPPRLHVQFLTHVLWSRVPNHFLKVDVSRISERQGWMIQCLNPLQFMALHIPEENRLMFVCWSIFNLNKWRNITVIFLLPRCLSILPVPKLKIKSLEC